MNDPTGMILQMCQGNVGCAAILSGVIGVIVAYLLYAPYYHYFRYLPGKFRSWRAVVKPVKAASLPALAVSVQPLLVALAMAAEESEPFHVLPISAELTGVLIFSILILGTSGVYLYIRDPSPKNS